MYVGKPVAEFLWSISTETLALGKIMLVFWVPHALCARVTDFISIFTKSKV